MAWKNYWRQYAGPDYKFYLFVAMILILAAFVAYSSIKPQVQAPVMTTTTTTEPPKPITGNLVIAIKDGGIKLIGLGTATSLIVNIKSVDISDGVVNETNSTWVNVYSGSKSFDIIKYQNSSAIIVEKEFDPSSYHKVKFQFNDSEIKLYYYEIGLYNKTYPLIVTPEVTLPVDFSIDSGKKTVLTFDFDIPQSVVREPDANGVLAYKLKPKIQIFKMTFDMNETIPNSETV